MHPQGIRLTRAIILLTAMLIFGLVVIPVSAHALLLRSIPDANASLPRAPAQVELFFSEALEPSLSLISVLDANAQEVDQQDVQVDPNNPTHMTVSLRSLVDGVYTVSWKAISATDGHLTSGSFPFAVGNGQAAALASAGPQQKQVPLSTGEVVIQWLEVVALAILAAGKPFQSLIWRPSLAPMTQAETALEDPPAWNSLRIFSLLGLFALLAADLVVQATQGGRGGIVSLFTTGIGQILLNTRLGLIWLVRLALALLCGWLALSQPNAWKPWAAFGVTLLFLFTLSLTSHSAAEPQPFLPVAADWLHLATVSLWIGGLIYFVPAVRQVRRMHRIQQTRLISHLVLRFSALALTCVGVIGLTGIYSAVLRIGTLPALFNSLYGQALILKLALAALLLLLGATHLLIVSPRLKKEGLLGKDDRPLVRRFGRTILAEAILGTLVLLSASLLASLPPAVAAATTTDQSFTLQADDLQEVLTIAPGRVGLNTFTLKVTSNGQPVTLASEVDLRFSAIQQSLPPSEIQLVAQGSGTYLAKGSYLSLPGAWQIQTIVRRENKFDAYANLNLTVQNPASGSPSAENPHIAGALFWIIGVSYALLMLTLVRSPLLRVGLGGLPLAALLIYGMIFFTAPLPSTQSLVNPIPPNPASISAGATLFTAHCAACHGVTGKGDGPAGVVMRPPPADLTLHAVPGVHTDAQLFQWITQGYPGSQMPAFRNSLSDTDRWNLVNFIRMLAPR